jgi:hypothetical protein
MILYLRDTKDFTLKVLDLIHTFRKVARYRTYKQKSVVFLYTNNKHAEKKIKKAIPFKITLKTLGINLIKDFSVLRRKFIAMSAYIKKTERSQINDLMIHLKLLEKQEQENPKTNRRREIIKKEVKSIK